MKKIYLSVSLIFAINVSAQYTVMYDFIGDMVGAVPGSSLIFDGTYLYGTTYTGGTTTTSFPGGCGTVFKIKPDGTGVTALYDFGGAPDGGGPVGALYFDGTYLYGTTSQGGTGAAIAGGCGTVFKIKPDGTGYLKLHDFTGGTTDGAQPKGSLYYDGTYLYGTTLIGGTGASGNYGTIFKIKPDGTGETIVYNFAGATADGNNPDGSLISDGTFLYGTTSSGGTHSDGTVFKIMPNGTGETILHSFSGTTTDGKEPEGDLYYDGTFLYGMTAQGGSSANCNHGCGTIFKLKTDGTGYDTLLNFNSTNGATPTGSLISDGTYLYGMTSHGGTALCSSPGCGVLFKIMPNGTAYDTLHNFYNANLSGDDPGGSLFLNGGCLYGVTQGGGSSGGNDGVVFKYCTTTTGIKQVVNNKEQVSIYPNPSNGNFIIETNATEKQTAYIYDVNGKLVLTQIINGTTTIDASTLNDGVYNISLQSNEGVVNKRVVIVR